MAHALDVLKEFMYVDRNTFRETLFPDEVAPDYEELMWESFNDCYFSFLGTRDANQFMKIHAYCVESWEIGQDDLRDA